MAVVEPVLDQAAAERARLVNENRAGLLRSGRVVTLELLAEGQSKSHDAARQWARRQRRDHRLTYVVHANTTYVPTFQLDEAFDLRPAGAQVVAELFDRGFSDWAIWTWFESRSPWLGGQTPAEALAAGDDKAVRRALEGLLQD